jgi:hypothetical protein
MELTELPWVGNPEYVSYYERGDTIEDVFPDQDAHNLASGCGHNSNWGPLDEDRTITGFLLVQEGGHEGPDWIWLLTFEDGSTWFATGGCDYTGWDCQSWFQWEKYDG